MSTSDPDGDPLVFSFASSTIPGISLNASGLISIDWPAIDIFMLDAPTSVSFSVSDGIAPPVSAIADISVSHPLHCDDILAVVSAMADGLARIDPRSLGAASGPVNTWCDVDGSVAWTMVAVQPSEVGGSQRSARTSALGGPIAGVDGSIPVALATSGAVGIITSPSQTAPAKLEDTAWGVLGDVIRFEPDDAAKANFGVTSSTGPFYLSWNGSALPADPYTPGSRTSANAGVHTGVNDMFVFTSPLCSTDLVAWNRGRGGRTMETV